MEIRDLIYFDLDRAWSLFSQLEGGVVKETHESTELEKDERNLRKYDLKFFKPEFGGIETERASSLIVRELHHDVLRIVEERLSEEGMLLDVPGDDQSSDGCRGALERFPYARAKGWVSIEDYAHIAEVASVFDDLVAFIARCASTAIEATPEFRELTEKVERAQAAAAAEPDQKKKLNAQRSLARLEQDMRREVAKATGVEGVEPWLLDGMRQFIDAFMRDRILMRMFPWDDPTGLQILSNLKRDCFVDGDISVY